MKIVEVCCNASLEMWLLYLLPILKNSCYTTRGFRKLVITTHAVVQLQGQRQQIKKEPCKQKLQSRPFRSTEQTESHFFAALRSFKPMGTGLQKGESRNLLTGYSYNSATDISEGKWPLHAGKSICEPPQNTLAKLEVMAKTCCIYQTTAKLALNCSLNRTKHIIKKVQSI